MMHHRTTRDAARDATVLRLGVAARAVSAGTAVLLVVLGSAGWSASDVPRRAKPSPPSAAWSASARVQGGSIGRVAL